MGNVQETPWKGEPRNTQNRMFCWDLNALRCIITAYFSLCNIISKIWGLLAHWKVRKITCFYNRDAGIPK